MLTAELPDDEVRDAELPAPGQNFAELFFQKSLINFAAQPFAEQARSDHRFPKRFQDEIGENRFKLLSSFLKLLTILAFGFLPKPIEKGAGKGQFG